MKEKKEKSRLVLALFIVFDFSLAVILLSVSYLLINNKFDQKMHIDEAASKYLTFNYTHDEEQLYKLSSSFKFRDSGGIKSKAFSFEIFSDDSVSGENIDYEIVLIKIGNSVPDKYIKIYLTDENDKEIVKPTLFSKFDDSLDGKKIYENKFTKNVSNSKYKLRVWVDDSYEKKEVKPLAFKIVIRNK